MSVIISPTLLFLTVLELLVIPVTIIVVGFMFFYLKANHRRIIGSVLIVLGVLDMFIVLLRYPFTMVRFTLLIDIITMLLGIVSLFYSSKYH